MGLSKESTVSYEKEKKSKNKMIIIKKKYKIIKTSNI